MSKLAINLYGREYFVNCDPGDESRLKELIKFVESKMKKAAEHAGSGTVTESRLFMLTCLLMADELIETQQSAGQGFRKDEDLLVAAVEHLRQRVSHIASQVGRA